MLWEQHRVSWRWSIDFARDMWLINNEGRLEPVCEELELENGGLDFIPQLMSENYTLSISATFLSPDWAMSLEVYLATMCIIDYTRLFRIIVIRSSYSLFFMVGSKYITYVLILRPNWSNHNLPAQMTVFYGLRKRSLKDLKVEIVKKSFNLYEDFSVCLWKVNLMCSPNLISVGVHGARVRWKGDRVWIHLGTPNCSKTESCEDKIKIKIKKKLLVLIGSSIERQFYFFSSFLWKIGRAIMFKVEMSKSDFVSPQEWNPKGYFSVMIQFKKKFILPTPPTPATNWIWEIILSHQF